MVEANAGPRRAETRDAPRAAARGVWLAARLALGLIALARPTSSGASDLQETDLGTTDADPIGSVADPAIAEDHEYQEFLETLGSEAEELEAIDAWLAADPEAEASWIAYQDSLAADDDWRQHEAAWLDAVGADSALALEVEAFEEAVAADPDAGDELAAIDSLLAGDPELARRVEELETESASDPEGARAHLDAIYWLESHPQETMVICALSTAPAYQGADPAVAAYIAYLRVHPRLYHAWHGLYRHLHAHPLVARRWIAHGRWLRGRATLWRAIAHHRHGLAARPSVHRLWWQRRLDLGRRPALARVVRTHRMHLLRHPEWRRQHRVLARHPHAARALTAHRRWLREPGRVRHQETHAPPPHRPPGADPRDGKAPPPGHGKRQPPPKQPPK